MINAFAAHDAGSQLVPFEYDPGELKSGDVEIKVTHCGICHSDLSMLNNDWGITSYPFVPGHEVAGIISQVGEDVTHLKVGDKVGLGWHSAYCMTCSTCLGGDHNLCSTASATIVGRHGGFADKVRAEAPSVVKLPENMDLEIAGPLFCGGITVFNPLVQFGIEPTSKVGVIGIGGLGHIALQFLKSWGCEVVAFTSSESKKQEALEMGAHRVINSRSSEELDAAANSLDMIMSTVNVKLDWNTYLNVLKPKGRLHFLGATLEPLDLNLFPMLMGQKTVSSSELLTSGKIK